MQSFSYQTEIEEIPSLSLKQAPGSDGFSAKYYKIFKDILNLTLLSTYNTDSRMKLFQIEKDVLLFLY